MAVTGKTAAVTGPPAGLVASGFEEAHKHKSATRRPRMVMSIGGIQGKGKTTLALTAPGPIALIDMDTGLEGVIQNYMDQKKIYVASYNYRDATDIKEWEQMWEKSNKAFYATLRDPAIRTVVIDTATEWYEMVKMARFGKLNKVAMVDGKPVPLPYGPVNAEFRNVIREAYNSDKNLILVHKHKKQYVNDKWSGEWEIAGMTGVEFDVQVAVTCMRDPDEGFMFRVDKCRLKAAVEGLVFGEPMNTFPFLAAEVFGTGVEEWEEG